MPYKVTRLCNRCLRKYTGYGKRFCSRQCLGKAQRGECNPFFGKKHSEEARSKMRNPDREEQEIRYKTKKMCHGLIWRALKLKRVEKDDKTCTMLGYTPTELRAHLEKLFVEGMTWKNHGLGKDMWHVDHIRPVNTFQIGTSPSVINALSNLRPLWSHENIRRPKNGSDVI